MDPRRRRRPALKLCEFEGFFLSEKRKEKKNRSQHPSWRELLHQPYPIPFSSAHFPCSPQNQVSSSSGVGCRGKMLSLLVLNQWCIRACTAHTQKKSNGGSNIYPNGQMRVCAVEIFAISMYDIGPNF